MLQGTVQWPHLTMLTVSCYSKEIILSDQQKSERDNEGEKKREGKKQWGGGFRNMDSILFLFHLILLLKMFLMWSLHPTSIGFIFIID